MQTIPIPGYERVVHATDPDNALDAYIAVHNTKLGPALGGLRMLPYPNEAEALEDVTRLARAMTYKHAVAQTRQGGGKAVIVGDPSIKREGLLRAMGRFIDALDGAYITAEDMNITESDLETLALETKWVSGRSVARGFSGNPSPMTALGCLYGLRACAAETWADPALEGRHILIQGVGAVGTRLAELCLEHAMRVTVCDANPDRARALSGRLRLDLVPAPDDVYDVDCDIFSPCGRGAVLNADSIPRLRCAIVAGAANNQLATPEDADRLRDRHILYAPDYVINAGGIINISCEFRPDGYSESSAREAVKRIEPTLAEVFRIAHTESITPAAAADRLAERRLAMA